jgi:DNA-3-methyladenine glycosylase I
MKKCDWCLGKELDEHYHDTEWGVPVHDDYKLFEFITLEGAQAGLSWSTVLAKRENYRKLFDNFDFNKVTKYNQAKINELLLNPGIIRNKLKVNSTVGNAKALLKVREEFGTFDNYIWSFVNHKTIVNKFEKMSDFVSKTEISDAMSKDLKKRGFKFVGTTICYAFMQATGMVNDHITSCFRYEEVRKVNK